MCFESAESLAEWADDVLLGPGGLELALEPVDAHGSIGCRLGPRGASRRYDRRRVEGPMLRKYGDKSSHLTPKVAGRERLL